MSLSHKDRYSTNVTDPSRDSHVLVSFTIHTTARSPAGCLQWQVKGKFVNKSEGLDLYTDFARSLGTELKCWADSEEALPVWDKLGIWDKVDDTTKANIITKILKISAQCISKAQEDERFRHCGTHVCETQVNKDCPFVKRGSDQKDVVDFTLTVTSSPIDPVEKSFKSRALNTFASFMGRRSEPGQAKNIVE
ncbi:MAG: hypothetical protein TREMPRED_005138 [Tremellales sp. Tagirdzhanova-0007]|nr:MAG: hypothetical protein TREMPRED_005138 [Tremellales sp. Tagirdzhanova-0007]